MDRGRESNLRRLPFFGEESGFTLIELLSAVVVTTIGVIALITTLDTSRELITFSEKRETAVHVAEQEIERIQSLPYEEIALTAAPATSGNAHDPAYYVTGLFYRWDLTPASGESGLVPRCSASGGPDSRCERLVVNGGTDVGTAGTISPSVTTIAEPGTTGSVRIALEVQRFVTWTDDPCPECTSQRDYKRVTVAVKIAGNEGVAGLHGGVVKPVILTTLVSEDRSL